MHFILRNGLRWSSLGQQVFRQCVVEERLCAAGSNFQVRFYAEQFGAQRARNASPKNADDKAGSNKDKITLHGVDGSISITSLEEATKLSKRRGLKLVREMESGKAQRPVYKLITIAKIIKQDEEKKSSTPSIIKGDKMLSLNNKIAEHDLQSRLKQIQKWLGKQQKVIVVISGSVSDLATSEKIFKQMEQVSQGLGRIVQKRTKGSEIRFQILPLPPTTTEEVSSSSSSNEKDSTA